jgi:hypothetical protein
MPPAMAGAAPSKSTARGKGVVDYNYGLFAPSLSAHTHCHNHNHNHNHTSNYRELFAVYAGIRRRARELHPGGGHLHLVAYTDNAVSRRAHPPHPAPSRPGLLPLPAATCCCCCLLLELPPPAAAPCCCCVLCCCCCYLLLLTAAAAAASCCSCRPLLLHPMLLRLLLLLPLAAVPPLMYLPLAVTAACYTRAAVTVCELCSVHEHLV